VLGLADLAVPFNEGRGIARGLRRLHVVLANALVIVAVFHATTAILHQFVFGDGTLARMMPWLRRNDLK
jgi:cytochrome b561